MWKLRKPTLRGDLKYFLFLSGEIVNYIIEIEPIFVNRHKSKASQPIHTHSALQPSFEPP